MDTENQQRNAAVMRATQKVASANRQYMLRVEALRMAESYVTTSAAKDVVEYAIACAARDKAKQALIEAAHELANGLNQSI